MTSSETGVCRVCLNAPAETREHIWPAGYLKRLDKAAPSPLAWTVNGEPVRKGNGKFFVQQPVRQRMFLPVCRDCNSKMDALIEQPAQALSVALVLSRWAEKLTAEQWVAVGRWWMKVLLMTGHEDARLGDDGLHQADPFATTKFEAPMPDLSWLVSSDALPAAASLFVFRADPDRAHDTAHRLVIPRSVAMNDGAISYCHHINLSTAGIAFLAVWHPGITIKHPLVAAGEAWEILHNPPSGPVSLASLPEHSHQRVAVIGGHGRVREGHQVDDSSYSNLVGKFGYDSDGSIPVSSVED